MSYLTGVGYLEDEDVDQKGNLINPEIPTNVPIILMIYASWCPHCEHFLPTMNQFAEQNRDKVCVLAIQADDSRPSVQALASRIKTMYPDFRGFPTILKFKNGKRVKNAVLQERSMEGLKQLAYGQ